MNRQDRSIQYVNILADAVTDLLSRKPENLWRALHLQRYYENWLEIEISSQLFVRGLLGQNFEFRGFDTPYATEGSESQKHVDLLLASRDGTTYLWLELKTANLDVPEWDKRRVVNQSRKAIKQAADALSHLHLPRSIKLWTSSKKNVKLLLRQRLKIKELRAEAVARRHVGVVLALGCGSLEDPRSLVSDVLRCDAVIHRQLSDSEWLIALGRCIEDRQVSQGRLPGQGHANLDRSTS